MKAAKDAGPERLRDDSTVPTALRDALHLALSPEVDDATRLRLAESLRSIPGPRGGGAAGPSTRGRWVAAGAGFAAVAVLVGSWLATRHPAAPAPAPALPFDASSSIRVVEVTAREPTTAPTPTSPPADLPADVPTGSPARPHAATTAMPPHSRGENEVLPDEATLLRDARAALRSGDPRRALVLLATHARRFPNGTFAQERDVLRVDALVASGRSEEAREAARAFLAENPESAHRAHIESILTKE